MLVAVVTVASLASAALALGKAQPLTGIYRGTVTGTPRHNAGQGCFIEKPTVFGKRVKPASGHGTICRDQIIAPSLGPVAGARKGCNAKPAVLATGGFPIRNARFHYRGRAHIGRHRRSLKVDFRGRWVTRTRVVGSTQISGRGCNSFAKWKMRTRPG